jgi:hypothetical protein
LGIPPSKPVEKSDGDDHQGPTGLQVKALTDVGSGHGWNAGIRKQANPNLSETYYGLAENYRTDKQFALPFIWQEMLPDPDPIDHDHRNQVNNQ